MKPQELEGARGLQGWLSATADKKPGPSMEELNEFHSTNNLMGLKVHSLPVECTDENTACQTL